MGKIADVYPGVSHMPDALPVTPLPAMDPAREPGLVSPDSLLVGAVASFALTRVINDQREEVVPKHDS